MIVEDWPIEKVIPYENNPRKNDEAVEKVANSIREFSFQQPIVVDQGGVIIAGHTRYKAAQMLGLSEVPVTIAEGLTENQIQAYRLADNKTGELSDWDFDKLNEELEAIDWFYCDMSQFGFCLDDDLPPFDDEEPNSKTLKERFGVVPFSVIYANRGDWLERKRKWVALGVRSEIGRGGDLLSIAGCLHRQTSYKENE